MSVCLTAAQILVLLVAPLPQLLQMGPVDLIKLDHKVLAFSVLCRIASAGDLDELIAGTICPDLFVVAVKSRQHLLKRCVQAGTKLRLKLRL